jgi:curved DNA-binding protein
VEASGNFRPVTKTLEITIPRGIANGATIRLAGQASAGGQSGGGDLLLQVNIHPDPRFRLAGHDLHTVVAVSPWEAALGVKVQIQTLSGKVILQVPKGSQNGSSLRLRGKGMAKKDNSFGDLIATLEVCLPEKLTADEERLLSEIAKISRFDPRCDTGQKAPVTDKV